MTFVSDLQPTSLWGFFDQILAIPRGSKEESRIRDWIVGIADARGLTSCADAAGNLIVRKPASPGREAAPVTVLQAHLDMVTEKNSEVDFDFATDAIRPVLEDGYLTADGTTLGSDNGIGVAAMLAVMEADDLEHGPLELLFTVDEETGLTGAQGLDASLLKGRRLLNLDSEEEGTVTVGCAGGADTHITLPLETRATPAGFSADRVKLRGLHGGHSGIDIHLQRGNAVQLLARILRAAGLPGPLAGLQGGDKHNAIPREAWATVVLPAGDRAPARERLRERFEEVRREFARTEPGMELHFEEVAAPEHTWSDVASARVLDLLLALPHGVVATSTDIPGLVETSTNLAAVQSVSEDGDSAQLNILTSSRSSVSSALEGIRQTIDSVARLAGARREHQDGYPGWQPDLDSELLAVVRAVHTRVLEREPRIEAVHAGLECGLIGQMIPDMDMVSFGPQIEFPHSPGERVKVDSVGRFYRLLTETLSTLSR